MPPHARKRVLVTGASSGIGRALALHYWHAGWAVVALARRADLLGELTTESGGGIRVEVADVTDAARLDAVFGDVGSLDLVIANAGIAEPGGDPADRAAVHAVTAVNFLGVVNTLTAALPAMVAAKSGHLVAVGSMAGYKGLPGSAAYSATKAAVRVYCEALRIELRPQGVAVTCVNPGFVTTPMTADKPHPMPFCMSADAAAALIARRLAARPGVVDFPRRMRWLMRLAGVMPDAVVRRAAGPRPRG